MFCDILHKNTECEDDVRLGNELRVGPWMNIDLQQTIKQLNS